MVGLADAKAQCRQTAAKLNPAHASHHNKPQTDSIRNNDSVNKLAQQGKEEDTEEAQAGSIDHNDNNEEAGHQFREDLDNAQPGSVSGCDNEEEAAEEQEEDMAQCEEEAQDEYSQAPWERPCLEPFEWDGNRDVMVLVEPSSNQRGWCQGRVIKDTAKTMHFSWPGEAHGIQSAYVRQLCSACSY